MQIFTLKIKNPDKIYTYSLPFTLIAVLTITTAELIRSFWNTNLLGLLIVITSASIIHPSLINVMKIVLWIVYFGMITEFIFGLFNIGYISRNDRYIFNGKILNLTPVREAVKKWLN